MFKSKKCKHEISIFCFQNNSDFLEGPYGHQNKNDSPSDHKLGMIRGLTLYNTLTLIWRKLAVYLIMKHTVSSYSRYKIFMKKTLSSWKGHMTHKKIICISAQTVKPYYNKSYKCLQFDLVQTYIIFNLHTKDLLRKFTVLHVYLISKIYALESPWTAILNYCFENCNHSRLVRLTSYTVKTNLHLQNHHCYDCWLIENNAESQLSQMELPNMKVLMNSPESLIYDHLFSITFPKNSEHFSVGVPQLDITGLLGTSKSWL